jgi:L-asparaginase
MITLENEKFICGQYKSKYIRKNIMHSQKKILLIFCGGTISMTKNEATGALDIAHGADQLFKLEPRIIQIASISVCNLLNVDSTNITTEDWIKIGETIETNYKDYDGFVVTMGTNTLAYASSALSFSLQKLGKPIVFTGAQIPAEAISTDARNNLVNALRVSTMDIAGVFVVFGSKVILGSRAKKLSESDLDAFGSFNDSDFGEISIGIKINREDSLPHNNMPDFKNSFNKNIISLTFIPGFEVCYLNNLMESGIKGVILRGFGAGDISYDFIPFLEHAREKKVPVIVTTQCRGSTVMGLNDPGLKALEAGVIQAFDMSMESMSTKLMWMLAQNIPYEEFKGLFHTNMAGEINIKRTKFFINKELSSLVDYQKLV